MTQKIGRLSGVGLTGSLVNAARSQRNISSATAFAKAGRVIAFDIEEVGDDVDWDSWESIIALVG
jgi:hypothetical protein